jgi:hypothetical protein
MEATVSKEGDAAASGCGREEGGGRQRVREEERAFIARFSYGGGVRADGTAGPIYLCLVGKFRPTVKFKNNVVNAFD